MAEKHGMPESETWPDWVRDTHLPAPPPPALSCDVQFHIFDQPDRYPVQPNAAYEPPAASFADAVAMHQALGFARGVIVHSVVYGSDHRLLLDTLEGLPSDLRRRYRATCILDDSVTDADMARLDAAGVCAARVNFVRYLKATPEADLVRRSFDRLREIGWHARLHVTGDQLLEHSDLLCSIKDVPMVIDHMAHIGRSGGLDQPAMRWMLDRLRHDNWWMMLSNGNRDSKMDSVWDDAVPFGCAFVAAAPERCIWASDWPHPRWQKKCMMNDAEAVELFYRYVDNDQALVQQILVDNPARLHGFED
jgi:predicted TIM-barrel fold metal-dependent hydrolase